jgi:citrate synthase
MRKYGLEGIVVAETGLSLVDGANGRLVIRGHELRDLVRQGTRFEDAAALLWDGLLPLPPQPAEAFAAARLAAWPLVPALLRAADGLTVVEALRVGLAMLPDQPNAQMAFAAPGALAVFIPALVRQRAGLPAVGPDAGMATAADVLHMLRGQPAGAAEVAALDAYLVTVSDHGLNASTFAARVIASTRAGLGSALLGGLCALKGPLHGGAPGPVLDMLDEVGTAANARAWLERALLKGDRLMGFGHRIYRVRDPRADVLKEAVRSLSAGNPRIALAEQVERAALTLLQERQPGRRLDTNVEFYTALLLEALALPRDAFTAVFALGRSLGWVGHVLEQERDGVLIRPDSLYAGPLPAQAA